MGIIHIITDTELRRFVNGDNVNVVKLSASWCRPCAAVAPRYKSLAEKYEGSFAQFAEVDIDTLEENWNVNSVPTFAVYKDGDFVDTILGTNLEPLDALLQTLGILKLRHVDGEIFQAAKINN